MKPEELLRRIRTTKKSLKQIAEITAKYVCMGTEIIKTWGQLKPKKILGMTIIVCPDCPPDQIFMTAYMPCKDCPKNKTKLCKGWPK